MRSAVMFIAVSAALAGCESLGEQVDKIIVPKIVEAPQQPGPDECIQYHADFPKLQRKGDSAVLPPSEFLGNWNSAKKKYRALNKDHSVCRAWHMERRIQIDKARGDHHSDRKSS